MERLTKPDSDYCHDICGSVNGCPIDELGKYLASMFIKHNHELMGRTGKKWSKLYQLWRTEEQKRRPRR